MILLVTTFSLSLIGIILLIGFKMRAERAEQKLMLGHLDEMADKNLREGISLAFRGVGKVKNVVNKDNAKYIAGILIALIFKIYVISKVGFRKYFSGFFDAVGGKKLIKKKGAVSFFLKDILEYKNSLSKDKKN